MINIYVVRHGETDFNKNGQYLGQTDTSLNSTGIAQAQELAENTRNLSVDIIYCSPLKRAIETTEIINSKHNCRIITDQRFIERSIGVYEGLTKEEARNKYPVLYERNITRIFNEAPPNGETIEDVKKRVFLGLDEIKSQSKFSDIMIVSHGFVAKVINKYFNTQITESEFFDFCLTNGEVKKYTFISSPNNLALKSLKP